MKRFARAGASLVVVLPFFTFAAPAAAVDPEWDIVVDGAPNVRPVSGVSGNVGTTVLREGGGVRGIEISENADRPCFVRFASQSFEGGSPTWRPDDDAASKKGAWVMGSWCIDDTLTDKPASKLVPNGKFGQTRDATLGAEYFVSSLQVCTNGANDSNKKRVKGLRLFASRVDPATGVVTKTPTVQAEYSLPNCKDWESKSTCPDDMVATQLDFHMVSHEHGLSGIALRCQKVKRVKKPPQPLQRPK